MASLTKDPPTRRQRDESNQKQAARTTSGARGACTAMAAALLLATACGSSDKEPDDLARGGRTSRGGASAAGGTSAKGGNTPTDTGRGGTVNIGGSLGNASAGSSTLETGSGGSTAAGGTTAEATGGSTGEGGSAGAPITTLGGSSSGGTAGASSAVAGGTGGTSVCIAPSKPAGTGEVLSFNAARDYPTSANYVGLPFDLGDINHDGYLDVVMALTNGGRIALLRGTADGAFGAATEVTISAVNNSWLKDLDADGDLDLLGFQSNLSQNRALVALGNGDGTFGAPTPIFNLSSHGNVQFHNLVGDASVDLLVAHYTNEIQLYAGDGHGGFTLSSTLTSSATIRHYVVADLDGDKQDDLVVASTSGTSTQQLEIAWGLGAGKFSAFSKFDLTTLIGETAWPPTDLLVGDVNQDQIQDLVVVGVPGAIVLLGSSNRIPVFQRRISPLAGVSGAALKDLDGDGHLDLALSNSTNGLLTLYYGYGDGTFSAFSEYSSGSMGSAIRTGDIDADGDVDLVLSSGSMTVIRNLGARHWEAARVFRRGTEPTLVRLGDLNHDGHLDLLSLDGTDFVVSLGDGTGRFLPATVFAFGEKPVDLEFFHANDDGHLDVAFTTNANHLGIMYGDGTGALTASKLIDSGPNLAVGDVDEDGQSELLTANYNTLFVHEVFGTSTWTTKTAYVRPTVGSNYPSFSNLILGDLDRDQHLDAVLSGYDTKDVTLLRGAGDKSFVLDRTLSASYGVYQTLAADFTGDCRTDLMVAQFTSYGSLLYFSGLPGAEWSPASTLTANYGCDMGSADLDSDGWLDATLVHWGLNVCQLELNRGGGTFERKSFNCNSVEHHAIGDLNGDGRPDIVLSHNSPQYLSIVLNTSKP